MHLWHFFSSWPREWILCAIWSPCTHSVIKSGTSVAPQKEKFHQQYSGLSPPLSAMSLLLFSVFSSLCELGDRSSGSSCLPTLHTTTSNAHRENKRSDQLIAGPSPSRCSVSNSYYLPATLCNENQSHPSPGSICALAHSPYCHT